MTRSTSRWFFAHCCSGQATTRTWCTEQLPGGYAPSVPESRRHYGLNLSILHKFSIQEVYATLWEFLRFSGLERRLMLEQLRVVGNADTGG